MTQYKGELLDLLPLSYNHLLFSPTLLFFPVTGLGVPGTSPPNRLVPVLTPNPLGEPNEDRRPFMPLATARWNRGLLVTGDPLGLLSEAGLPPPLADKGELL